MNFTKTLRAVGLTFACGTALAGLYGQNASTEVVPSSVDQDFLLVRAAAEESVTQSAVETLSDWEFTARARPLKCRFVN